MLLFKKKCDACGEKSFGWFALSQAVRSGKVRCGQCKTELLASSSTRWFMSFVGALLVPLFIMFFIMTGFWGGLLLRLLLST